MFKLLKTSVFVAIVTFSSYSYGYANSAESAREFVNKTANRVENLLKENRSPAATEQRLNSIFADVADIEWLGKFALGKNWRTLTSEQKIAYLKQYKQYLFYSYVPLFRSYNGQKFDMRGAKNLGEGQYLVSTGIRATDDTSSYNVDYRLKYANGTFKLRDIIAEGVSMIATQRSDFSSIINEDGFDVLMQNLRDKSE